MLCTWLSEVDREGAVEPADEVDDVVGGAVEGERHVEGAPHATVLHLFPDVVAVAQHARQHLPRVGAGVRFRVRVRVKVRVRVRVRVGVRVRVRVRVRAGSPWS